MQYSQGICDATARPISSRTFDGSVVFLFRSVLFINAHPAALALSGYNCISAGTLPSVFFISANAASDGLGSSALAALETKTIPPTAAITKMAIAKLLYMSGNVNCSHDYFLLFGNNIGFCMCYHIIFQRKIIYKLTGFGQL
jgi:hypothetical protein